MKSRIHGTEIHRKGADATAKTRRAHDECRAPKAREAAQPRDPGEHGGTLVRVGD